VIAGSLEIEMFANIARLTNDMNQAKGVVSNSMSTVEKSVESAKKVLATLGLGLSVGVLVNKFQQVAIETDKLRANLSTVTGSTDAAAIAFDNLTKFAAKTPFTLDQSVNAFIKLKSLGLDPSERALTSYGNTAAAMGYSMSQMIEAVADASTNEFERLKTFGIKAKQQGDNVTFIFQGVSTTVKKESEAIQEYLLNIGETTFAAGMSNQMLTLTGALSNFEDNVDSLFRKMADDGGTQIFAKGIKASSDAVALLADNTDVLYDAVLILSAAMTAKMIPALGKTTAGFIAGEIEAVRYQLALASMAGVSGTTAIAQTALTSTVTAFKGALTLVGGPIGATVIALGALVVAYNNITEAQDQARKGAANWISSTGGLNEINLAIQGTEGQINDLRKVIAEDNGIFSPFMGSASNKARDEIKKLELYLADLRAEQNKLIESQAYLSEGMDGFIGPIQGVSTALTTATDKLKVIGAELGIGAKKIDYTTESLLDMDSVMRSLDTGHVVGLDTTFADLNARIEATQFRMIGVTDVAPKVTKEMATLSKEVEYQKNMLENVQREWANLIDQLIDGEADFGDFFDSIAKGFKRMIAEMAAADLMNAIFGGQGLGALTNGNLAGLITGGLSAVTGGAGAGLISGAAGLLGGGAAAATAGTTAVGTTMVSSGAGALTTVGAGGGGFGSTIAALASNPLTWAAGALALGFANDWWSDPDGYKRTNAGFFTAPTPGADPSETFTVPAFASGFKPIGYNHGASVSDAMGTINTFGQIDSELVAAINAAGGFVDMSQATLNGVNGDGQANTSGTFMGQGGKTSDADLVYMANLYASQLVRHAQGLSPELFSRLSGAGSVSEILSILGGTDGSHANGLDYVPFDGYRAILHKGERVQTAGEARGSNTSMDQIVMELRALRTEFARQKIDTKKTADILTRVTRDGNSLLTTAA